MNMTRSAEKRKFDRIQSVYDMSKVVYDSVFGVHNHRPGNELCVFLFFSIPEFES
jgi:hypothetical protein